MKEKILKCVDLYLFGNWCFLNCCLFFVIIKLLGICELMYMVFSDRFCIYKLKYVYNFWNIDKKIKFLFCIVFVDFKLILFFGFMGFFFVVLVFLDFFVEKLVFKFWIWVLRLFVVVFSVCIFVVCIIIKW